MRWAGDANIAIAIELPAGGEATRIVPKISDLHIQAVARVMLAPLVGEIPGFGAAVIALRYCFHSFLLNLCLILKSRMFCTRILLLPQAVTVPEHNSMYRQHTFLLCKLSSSGYVETTAKGADAFMPHRKAIVHTLAVD